MSKEKTLLQKPKPTYKCTCCGTEFTKQQGNFFKNTYSYFFKENGGYFSVCKACALERFSNLRRETASDAEAMRMFCEAFDIYYSEKVLNVAINSGHNVCAAYMSKVGLSPNQNKTYIDTLREETDAFILSHKIEENDRNKELTDQVRALNIELEEYKNKANEIVKEKEELEEVPDDVKEFWGEGYTSTEYKQMDSEYSSWIIGCNNGETPDKKLKESLVQICKMNIDIQRARSENEYGAISSLTKAYTGLLKDAGLSAEADNISMMDNNSFGCLIEKWENESPLPEIPDDMKDVGGLQKYIRVWFTGHLARMYGLKNKYSQEYEEEISKYNVSVESEYFEDDPEVGDSDGSD